MLASICGAASAVAASIRTCPLSDVTSSEVIPHVPTYQMLPNTWCGDAGSFHPASALHTIAGAAGRGCAAVATTASSVAAIAARTLFDIALLRNDFAAVHVR